MRTKIQSSLFGLYPLARHAIDDTVPSRVHLPHNDGDGVEGQGQSDHQPQPDIENYWIVAVIGHAKVHSIVLWSLQR